MLSRLKIFAGRAADGALFGGLNALQLLAADAADHHDGHRWVRGLAVLGLYLLARVAGEVGDGDLARNDVLHRVARDVSHEALGRPLEAVDGFSSPGELLRASLGDEVSRLLEGAVVYRALAARRLLDLLLRVGDGAAAGFHLRGLAAGLLAILLLDVLAGDGGVALLECALLDARPDAPLLLPLFQSVEESFGVVGPVQLAAIVDLGEVQVALARVGLRDLLVHRMEVGGAGAADGASGRLAPGDVAADVTLEAVEALGGATDLFVHLR